MVSAREPLYAKLTMFSKLNYLLFVFSRTPKQTDPCQSAGDEPQNSVRLL